MTANMIAKPCQTAASSRSFLPGAYYPLHSLLQTLRTMASHEDDICTLLAEMERTGRLSSAVRRDLGRLLSALPMHSLHQELGDLGEAMEQAA
jgi:hypothetical protein